MDKACFRSRRDCFNNYSKKKNLKLTGEKRGEGKGGREKEGSWITWILGCLIFSGSMPNAI